MKRLVLDRLWPMLLGLAVLLAGALLLEGYVQRRANDPLLIAIADERIAPGDDDAADAGAALEGGNEGPPLSEAHAQARALARRAEYAKALPLFQATLAANPDSPALLAEYGGCLASSGALDRAREVLRRADGIRPTFATALRLGQVQSKLGDPAAAEKDLRRALVLRPRSATASLALGQLLLRRSQPGEALELLRTAAASGSNDDRARALVALGGAQLARGDRGDAERSFDQAVSYAPARADVRIGIARAWLGTEGKDGAQRALLVLGRAAELAPDLPQVHTALGRARERMGERQLAQQAYELALRLDPSYRFARRRLIRLALSTNDLARARLEVDRLVSDGPTVPENHFLAARVATADGRIADARAAYRRGIEAADGDYPEAYLNLGVLERGAGNLEAARAAYDRALKLRPRYSAAWVNVGKLQEAQRQPAEAERSYQKAIEIDPRSSSAWLALGQLRSELERWADAEAALRRALELKDGGAALLSLGVVYARSGKLDEAVAAYRQVLAANPRNVAAWYDLALAELQRGRRDDARSALERALEVDAAHAGSLAELGKLELLAGRHAQARRAFDDLLDLSPGDRTARVGLAQADALAGNRAGCEARVSKLRAEAPGDPLLPTLAARCASAQLAPPPPSQGASP